MLYCRNNLRRKKTNVMSNQTQRKSFGVMVPRILYRTRWTMPICRTTGPLETMGSTSMTIGEKKVSSRSRLRKICHRMKTVNITRLQTVTSDTLLGKHVHGMGGLRHVRYPWTLLSMEVSWQAVLPDLQTPNGMKEAHILKNFFQ